MHLFHLIKNKTENKLSIAIADPNPAPLHNWKHCTSNTGMDFLRSPEVHHIDLDPFALNTFCQNHHASENKSFIAPNRRPSLNLFNHHSQKVISEYNLQDYWLRTYINDIKLTSKEATVISEIGEINARHIILAVGNGHQLNIPSWAKTLQKKSFPVHHIYSQSFSLETYKEGFHTVVVGSGMGAIQTFIKLAEEYSGKITLVTCNEIKVSDYDLDPGWMGPKYLHRFHSEKRVSKRRAMIKSARKGGTITSDINWKLRKVLKQEHTNHKIGNIDSAELFGSNNAYLTLENGDNIFCDQILMGTGFSSAINSSLIQNLKNNSGLRCSDCGYPIVDPFLRWHDRISVTGELAELEIGPAARNIIGAR
ncbi:MAG: FAD/NAD(P)-binding protein, partial [Balneolaceae bacterium]|nr:FAD/NAD(P)-binding protein [Balneolaceae bacterium]